MYIRLSYEYQPIHFSKPYYGKAIQPIGKANEERLLVVLQDY